ncbi:hypothetical protein [Kamptonema formosum]|uniref:hypothetical protein n=1 Tax=Kamptonema formosum TaxID=331992 RepID=UPI00034858E6|nr:hypothetical protein [Oscillatoria sp. PCC 10802]
MFRSVLALGAAEALAVDFKMKPAGAIKIDIGSRSLTNQTGTLSTQMSVCDRCQIEVKGASAIQAQGNLPIAI